jgi:hypothetical protein
VFGKKQTVINLDPIDRKRRKSWIEKLLITRWSGGKKIRKMHPYGHYMFCGPQGSGKTASALWYAGKLAQKYKRKGYDIRFLSNIGVGEPIKKTEIFKTINAFDPDAHEVRIVIIDEIHTYFPRGVADKETQMIRDDLTAIFSQLRKRQTFILSTAQIYGRLDKALREQCLYMIDCHVSINNKLVNEFIPEKDIIVDDLGRWAGNPSKIYSHGLSTLEYNTKRIIRE